MEAEPHQWDGPVWLDLGSLAEGSTGVLRTAPLHLVFPEHMSRRDLNRCNMSIWRDLNGRP